MSLGIRDSGGVRPKPTTVYAQLGGRMVMDSLGFFCPVLTFVTGKAKGGVGEIGGKELVLPFAGVLGKISECDCSNLPPPPPVDCRRIVANQKSSNTCVWG